MQAELEEELAKERQAMARVSTVPVGGAAKLVSCCVLWALSGPGSAVMVGVIAA